jgi:hypothetical protein
MSDDAQEIAEGLDEDKVDDRDDYAGDAFGDELTSYPPDAPLGVNTVGVTAVEEDAGESLAERTWREEPEVDDVDVQRFTEGSVGSDDRSVLGQLVDSDATSLDVEAQQIGEEAAGSGLTAEEAAMHVEPEP